MAEHEPPVDEPELAELRQLGQRLQPRDVTWEEPPARLWDRIAAATREPEPAAGETEAPPSVPAPTPITSAPRRRRAWLAGALAAAAALIVAVFVTMIRQDDQNVVAEVALDQLEGGGSGRAELIEGRDGRLLLRVDTEGLEPGDGYLELWMIDPSVTRLVSLGPLRAGGVYDVPAGVTPADFPIVDISAEPVDGDPTHSGRSLLRGQLPL
jgi:anti-sigma-K factor RskA